MTFPAKNYLRSFLLMTCLLIAPMNIFAGKFAEPDRYHLYVLENPNPSRFGEIEARGGRIDQYTPGGEARIFLKPTLVRELLDENFHLKEVKSSGRFILHDSHQMGNVYHSYSAVSFILDSLQQLYPDLCTLQSIGETVQGREIWAVKISDHPQMDEAEPEVRLLASMHGDEPLAQEMMLFLIDSLLQGYRNNSFIQTLVDSTEIWIVPNMNFDGTQTGSHFNANEIDLNRDFPDREFDQSNDPAGREPETQAVMNWSAQHHFVLAANFHSGALVVNYPWDKNPQQPHEYAATEDDTTFRRLALSYSRHNPDMYNNPAFKQGIINGATWYETSGTLQDWDYFWMAGMEVTIELSEEKAPSDSLLTQFWYANERSLFTYLEQVHSGLRGILSDAQTGQPVKGQILVQEIGKAVPSNPSRGDYYRLLEAGWYTVQYSATGYFTQIIDSVRIDSGQVTRLNIALLPRTYHVFSGTVSDSATGLTLSDARISFFNRGILTDSSFSDENGHFAIDLLEDSYALTIEKNGYLSQSDSLDLFSDQEKDFLLVGILPSVVWGTVKMTDSSSAANSIVYCRGARDTVDRSGRFQFNNLSAGAISVFAWKPGFRTARCDTILLNGDSLHINLKMSQGTNVFSTDFEDGNAGFTANGEWQWGSVDFGPDQAHSGQRCWATNLDGNYPVGIHLASLQTPVLPIQGLIMPQVQFYQWYQIEDGYDGGNLKISTDAGKTWHLLEPEAGYPLLSIPDTYGNPLSLQPAFSGKTYTWQKVIFNLETYKSVPLIQLRFDLGTDQQKEAAGWYIDDFRIVDANAVPIVRETVPYNKELRVTVYPNPANPDLEARISAPPFSKISIKLFTVGGRHIAHKRIAVPSSGLYIWHWSGRNMQGRQVASGMYLLQVSTDYRIFHTKIVVLK